MQSLSRFCRRPRALILSLTLAVSLVGSALPWPVVHSPIAYAATSQESDITQAIADTRKLLLAGSELSEWQALGLARSGGGVPVTYLKQVTQQVKDAGGQFRKVTDLERISISVLAAGGDAKAIGGYNLITSIYNHPNLTKQGTNGAIFALLALDSGRYEVPSSAVWTRDKILSWLLSQQLADGSFPLAGGESGNPDISAMALASLAPYLNQPKVRSSADQAMKWLASLQLADGGYKLVNEENSETIAQVIIGLTSVGLDPLDAAFVKPQGNVLTALLAYRQADGSFSHTLGGASNDMATEQALLALASYDRFKKSEASLYRITDEKPTVPNPGEKPDAVKFTDEAAISAWATDAVHEAYSLKLITGTSTSELRFDPKRTITRAEFAALLLRMLGESPADATSVPSGFKDVRASDWYAGYVVRAVDKGIIRGVSATAFQPNAPITREQMAVMIGRAYSLKDTSGTASSWKDASRIHADALPYVQAVAAQGILLGSAGSFDPAGLVTREMAAVAALRTHKLTPAA